MSDSRKSSVTSPEVRGEEQQRNGVSSPTADNEPSPEPNLDPGEEESEPEEVKQPTPPPPASPSPPPPPPANNSRSRNANHDFADSTSADDVLHDITARFEAETQLLRSVDLREYEEKGDLHGIAAQGQKGLSHCLNVVEGLHGKIVAALDQINAFNAALDKQMRESKLEQWIEKDKIEHSDVAEEIEVQRKEQMALGAESEQRLAETATASAECANLAAEMADRATKARAAIVDARQQAEKARIRYEEAKKADEEKRQLEEEARKKAEEKRRKLEEQERLRREEEEARRREDERIKGTPEEQEMRRKREEEERRERERRDPRNWPRIEYEIPGGEFEEGPVVVVRALESENLKKEDLLVQLRSPLSKLPSLSAVDDQVSSIFSIEPAHMENNIQMEEPWAIAIRHGAQRNVAREPIIMCVTSEGDSWQRMPSQEVHFEDMHGQKFVETRIKEPFCTLVVVSTVKTDRYQVGKRGNKTNSSVDSRIAITWPPTALRVTLDLIMQVQPVESHILHDLKVKHKDMMANLTSTSHIVHMAIVKKKTLKPITISFPVPFSSAKKPRPATAPENAKKEGSGGRPMTAFHGSDSCHDEDEELHIIAKIGHAEKWKELKVEIVQQKNKDIVSFDLTTIETLRFMGMRTRPGVSEEGLAKVANSIEEEFTYRSVCFILRQKVDDQMDVVIQAVPSNKLDRSLKQLHEEGFDEEGPLPSKEIVLTEGQALNVRFRGNVKVENHEVPITHMYHSQLRNRLSMYVCEKDKFAQKSIECYRGFAQIFTTMNVQRTVVREEGGVKKNVVEIKDEEVLLCELLINIPKTDPEMFKPMPRAEFTFCSNDSVNASYIRQLSQCVGREWKNLAAELGLSKPRIQAIRRNNPNGPPSVMVEDMLMTWIKRLPTSAHKAKPLATALDRCDRRDLADELRDQEMEFQANKKR